MRERQQYATRDVYNRKLCTINGFAIPRGDRHGNDAYRIYSSTVHCCICERRFRYSLLRRNRNIKSITLTVFPQAPPAMIYEMKRCMHREDCCIILAHSLALCLSRPAFLCYLWLLSNIVSDDMMTQYTPFCNIPCAQFFAVRSRGLAWMHHWMTRTYRKPIGAQ